ncbi:MAG: peptidoglycan DD-metalloendopeptidase family protein [Helicobacteraceae bacterium]|nr:peptidoglycan DD-metalloendopeptidase family protein [Helicobacteraceae bacterium]
MKFFLLALFCSALYASTFPKKHAVPGGVVALSVTASSKPKAFHEKQELMVLETSSKGTYRVIAGIPLGYDLNKPYEIRVLDGELESSVAINIKNKEYQKQYITLKTNKHVTLSKTNLDRHYGEKKRSTTALNSFTTQKFKDLEMIKPLNVKFSDDFGKRRYFNKKPKKPHSGIDLSAKEGTPMMAPLNGVIIEQGNFFFNGNVVFIDHGEGLVTMYCHLSKFKKKKGDRVKKGEIFGLVGKTGRVTGPHLHWGVSLNGNMVDPRLFFN